MTKEQIWRCFYDDGFFVDVRRKTRPRSSPYPHAAGLQLVEKIEEPHAETREEIWNALTKEVQSYALEMGYTHTKGSSIDVKYRAVSELSQAWEHANRSESALLKLRCLFLQNWLHYGRDGGYTSCIPHVSLIASLVGKGLSMQLRDTKEEMLERISALALQGDESAAWVLFALKQASPRYGRQHIVNVCIVCLMKALRREDRSMGDLLVTAILTQLWDALFGEEER